ncbi:MAG: SHOCT domain-containing protein [Candidatus Dormibacteraceae bacterium]
MMFFWLLVLVGLIAILVWAVIHFTGAGRAGGASNLQARQILDQRFARGEIDRDEYQRIRRELG